jgi:hypothetical protein
VVVVVEAQVVLQHFRIVVLTVVGVGVELRQVEDAPATDIKVVS